MYIYAKRYLWYIRPSHIELHTHTHIDANNGSYITYTPYTYRQTYSMIYSSIYMYVCMFVAIYARVCEQINGSVQM